MTTPQRRFPIQRENGLPPGFVSWGIAEEAYRQYENLFPSSARDQSLEMLASRGGFGWTELEALLKGEDFGHGRKGSWRDRDRGTP